MTTIDDRIAELVRQGQPFTADDVTYRGELAVDHAHQPNGRQSSIGAAFQWWSRSGYIEPTGEVRRSRAPHRKGGMIRVWIATDAGKRSFIASDACQQAFKGPHA